ncbi:MAG: right-handed parallel beta-helix repeat-containing protein [Deltaproteobacteria bacterium]|nr:right-handed parallel beta-helix repeat-containing protein [Deltaproteobacteria bacterium]
MTLYGRNFGAARGDGHVVVCGRSLTEAADYLSWGAAAAVPTLQTITFLVPADCASGPTTMQVSVGGTATAALPFLVRPGEIHHVAAGAELQSAIDALSPGAIAYLEDGVAAAAPADFDACVNLPRDGAENRPIALVGLPGATVTIGNPAMPRALHNWVGARGGYARHWTIAQIRFTTDEQAIAPQTGWRVVGNRFTAPQAHGGMSGVVEGIGDHLRIYGNELYALGRADVPKLYHALYITGVRRSGGSRAATETDRDIGWNYFHDNNTNRAINIYSEESASAFIENHRIHDNLIVDQRGDGILLGAFVTGTSSVYNNVIVRAGLGPEWDEPSSHAGIRLYPGHPERSDTVVNVFHNTLVDNGYAGAAWEESGNVFLQDTSRAVIAIRNNVFVSHGEPHVAGESQALAASAARNLFEGGAAPAWDTAAVAGGVMFVAPQSLDFRLAPGSPARDVGDAAVAATVPSDFAGVRRPLGAGADLGAYEATDSSKR